MTPLHRPAIRKPPRPSTATACDRACGDTVAPSREAAVAPKSPRPLRSSQAQLISSAAPAWRQHLKLARPRRPFQAHLCGALLGGASAKGSRVFTRSIFPSPVAPAWNSSSFGFPRASHTRDYSQRTSGRGQVIEHGPEPTLYVIDLASNPALITRYVRPCVARDQGEVRLEPRQRGDRSTGGPLLAPSRQPHPRGLHLSRPPAVRLLAGVAGLRALFGAAAADGRGLTARERVGKQAHDHRQARQDRATARAPVRRIACP